MGEAWWILLPVGGQAGKAFWTDEASAVEAATAGPGQMSLFWWDDQSGYAGRWREYKFPWLNQPPSYDASTAPEGAFVEVSGHYPPVFAVVGYTPVDVDGQTSLAEVEHLVNPAGASPGGVISIPSVPPMGMPGIYPMTAPMPQDPAMFSPWGNAFEPTAYELQNASSPWAPGAGFPGQFGAPWGGPMGPSSPMPYPMPYGPSW